MVDFGICGMWGSKWLIGSIILRRDIFQSAFGEAGLRLGVDARDLYGVAGRLGALYHNWKHYEYKLYVIVLVAWLVYFGAGAIKTGIRRNVKSSAIALAGISPVVWYFVLANHTAGHHFFTYRIYGISVLAIILILTQSVGNKEIPNIKKRLEILVVGLCVFIAGCGMSLLAREDIFVTNGYAEYEKISIREDQVCEMEFIPSFSHITLWGICMSTDAVEGVCNISVLDGGVRIYHESIGLEQYMDEKTYADIPVNWKLEKGKVYDMQISVEGSDREVFLLMTERESMPLIEYGSAKLGEDRYGQILCTLIYDHRPISHFTLFFLSVTWMGIFSAIFVVGISIFSDGDKT